MFKIIFTKINKKSVAVFLTVFSIAISSIAQTTADTINNPLFIEMMQDRSVNFYQTQRAAELWFNNRTRQKGDGWKPYKRWEWNALNEIDANGNFPNTVLQDAQAELMKQNGSIDNVVVPGMSSTGGTCNNSGVWKSMGPNNLPTNNTGQLNGLGRLNAVAVHPTDSNTIFVGAAAGGIWKTSNGGTSWNVYSDSLPTLGVSAIAIDPNTPNTMYFGSGDRDAGDALGRGVFKSTDGGSSWTLSNTGMGNREVGRLIIDPNNTSILLAGCDNGIYRSTNAGVTWTRTLATGWVKEIIFMPGNSNVAYAERGGRFYRTLDNGVTWTLITTGLPTTARSRGVIDVSALDSTLVYFWVANNRVNRGFYLSRDSGTTFTTMSTTPNIHDYATNGSGTGGQAWYNKDMTVAKEDAGVIYAAGVNIFKSTDTGKTWTISAYWVNTVHADNHAIISDPITKRIYSANDGGLYYTADAGNTWTDISNGLGIAQIYKIGASRTQKDILIAGFQDNGTGNFNNGWYTSRGGDGMDCEVDQEDSRYSYGALYYGSIFRVFNVNSQGTIAANGTNGITEQGGWVTPYTLREGLSETMYVGYKNIWRSTNVRTGTPTWTRISNNLGGVNNSNMTEIENSIGNPDILYISRSNGQLWRSDNINAATPTYTQLTQPVGGTVRAIETDPTIASAVYIGIGTRVYRSLNKGGAWTQVNNNLPSNVRCILLDTSSPVKGIYVGTQRNGLWYTDTTRTTWRYFSAGLPPTVNVSDLELYYEADEDCKNNTLYASTYNRGVWHSSTFHDGTQKPVAKVEKYDSVICSTATVSLNDNSCNVPTEWLWEFTPNTVSYVQGDSSSENVVVSFASKGTYQFTHYAKNCNGYDSTIGVIIVGDSVKSACVPTATNSWNSFGIFNFQFANINRTSSGVGGEGAHVDVACTDVASVKEGQTYNVSATTSNSNDEQVKIWIDFNNDGDFADAGELVWSPARARTNHSGSFTIPNPAITTGEILRMRVRTDFNSIANNRYCGNVTYGQAEDYGLYIEPDTSELKFVVSDTNLCAGESVVITDSTLNGAGKTYTWNFGDGASPATASTVGPHTIQYATPGYKRIVLYVGSDSLVKDSAILVDQSPFMTINLANNDSLLCAGESVKLEAVDANNSSATFQWQLNEVDVADSTFNHYFLSNTSSADSGNYRVIATYNTCADTSENMPIHIFANPTAAFTTNFDSSCFNGHQVSTNNTSSISDASTLKYEWQLGNGSNATSTDTNFSYATNGLYTLKLLASTIHNCMDSASKVIDIKASPVTAVAVNDSSQCFDGNSFVWTNNASIASGTLTYSWNFGDGNTSISQNPTHSYSTANDSFAVWLKATSDRGCADSILAKAEVNPSPTIAFSTNDSAQCFNLNAYTFTNTSAIAAGRTINYSWTFGDGNSSIATSPIHTYLSSGTFTTKLVGTSSDGCMDSLSKDVTVDPNTSLAFTLNKDSQCYDGNSYLINNTSNIASGTYTANWNFGDGNTSTNLNPPAFTYATFANSYDILLTTNSDKNCKDTLEHIVYLFENPVASFSVNDSTQCLNNNNFIFTNSSTISAGTLNYFWTFGDGNTNTNVSPNHAYLNSNAGYDVKMLARTTLGCVDSITKVMEVYAQPQVGFSINDSTQCFLNNQIELTNTSSVAAGTNTYSWNFGDGNTSTATSPNHNYLMDGNYTVKLVALTDEGCSDSFSKPVEISPSPTANFNISDADQCFKANSFDFTNASNVATGTLNYDWDFGDGTTSTSVSITNKTFVSFMDSSSIKLVVRTPESCKDSITKKIYIYQDPSAAFTVNDTNQCFNGNNFVFANQSANTNPSSTYNWAFGDGNTSTAENPNHSYLNTNAARTVVLEVVSDKNCKDTAELVVSISPNPIASFTINDSTQCFAGNQIVLTENGSISTGTYQFEFNLGDGNTSTTSPTNHSYASNGNYIASLTATSDSGCTNNSTKNVEINAMPVVDFSVNDSAQCLDANAFAFADLTPGLTAAAVKSWKLNGAPAATGDNYNNSFTAAELGSHNIRLTITTEKGCADSLEKIVSVDVHPDIALSGPSKVCINDQINLNASSSIPGVLYSWTSTNGENGAGNPITINGNNAGLINISIQATNAEGCITDSIFNNRVSINALPIPIIDTSLVSLTDGIELTFIDGTNIPVNSRVWQFIPSASGSNIRESFVLRDTATYTTTLNLIDTNGCEGSTTESYFVVIPNNYYLPTAFTPNDDGLNDIFKIPGYINVQTFSLRIFNRWGEILFETTDPTVGWDGKVNGQPVMDGSYGYMIEILDFNNKRVVRQGTVNILR